MHRHHYSPKYLLYLLTGLVFIIVTALTDAHYWADSADYTESVIAYLGGRNYLFWEFGHLLWRPLGYLMISMSSETSQSQDLHFAILKRFQWVCWILGFCSVLVFTNILRKLRTRDSVVLVSVSVLTCSHAFLNFSQTGTSYIPGLFFLILGLRFMLISENEPSYKMSVILAGVSFAASISLWIAYVWAVPGAMMAGVLLPGEKLTNVLKKSFVSAASFAMFVTPVFIGGGYLAGATDISTLLKWISEAAHGNDTAGVLRTAFGLARSFFFLSNYGMLLKRFTLGDPFNSVSLGMLLTRWLVKLIIFYLLAALTMILAWRGGFFTRRYLLFAGFSATPLVVFAIFFDGGAVERYLPLIPSVLLAFAIAIDRLKPNSLIRMIVVAVALIAVADNVMQLSLRSLEKQNSDSISRIEKIYSVVGEHDKVFMVNWNDDLINFNRSFPFHNSNTKSGLRLNALVTPGLAQSTTWREEFAARTLAAWKNGANVWISNRATSSTPEPSWNWTEVPGQEVHWRDFPEFFTNLEISKGIDGQDEISLVTQSDKNRAFLSPYAGRYARSFE